MTHPIDDIIALIEKAGETDDALAAICHSMPPGFEEFMNAAIDLFVQAPVSSQLTAFAIMFAQVCASIEGETVTAEAESGCLITFEDRLRLLVCQSRAVFKEAYAFRSHPDCPKPPSSTVM